MTQQLDFKKLADFFPASAIEWRAGNLNYEKTRAQAVPYINARAVQQRLDDVCGPENWKNEFKPSPMNNGVICVISIRTPDGDWVSKEDGAQFEPEGPDSTSPEMAVKGAYSNALKRAAVMWGIGRYLYSVNHTWVEVDDAGNFTKTPTLPSALLPPNDKSVSPAPRLAAVPAPKPVSVESTKGPAPSTPASPAAEEPPQGEQASQGTVPSPAPAPGPAAAPAEAPDVQAEPPAVEQEDAAPGVAAKPGDANTGPELTADMLDALDNGTRNYVQQLVRYINEGRNLTTVHTALTNGRAKERLADSHPDILKCLKGMTEKRMTERAAA